MGRSGFLHFDDLEYDSLRLLMMVAGLPEAYEMLERWTDENSKPVMIFPDSILEPMLISLAVRYRLVEDRYPDVNTMVNYPFQAKDICAFRSGEPTKSDLKKSGLRLASDKIIHAHDVVMFGDTHGEVICSGEHANGKEWTVSIDLRRFAVAGICLAQQYDENWEVSSANVVVFEVT